MTDSYDEFQSRVSRIYDKQGKRSSLRKNTRAIYTPGKDGYTVVRGARHRRPFPWTGILFLFIAFFTTKGAVMARLGVDTYAHQLTTMAPSNWLEQAGAWTLQPDPVSQWVARHIEMLS